MGQTPRKKRVREATAPDATNDAEQVAKRLQWWKDARFGMFIHWGLYALPAGRWEGRYYDRIGEWIMHSARIPVKRYEKLAREFNPVQFDAKTWVSLAKQAGMKYLVITAKHHDGFSMFHSPSSSYNIVDATPWAKDPMRDLARECRKAGIRFCFYYSQTQDWYERNGDGNTWDFRPPTADEFRHYLEHKVKPQLRELLTQYGPIGLIWFDTPRRMTRQESLDLKQFVHSLQPDCIVSGRIGNNLGDYGSLGDNQIPRGAVPATEAWETPATMNDTWGYKTDDKNWKSVETLLKLLIDLASKGINYLLNVGPNAEGLIPQPSVDRLHKIGAWLDANGSSIHGTDASPFPYEFSWGRMTRKGNRLYLHFFIWPRGRFQLFGLRNQVKRAHLLVDPEAKVELQQEHNTETGQHLLILKLPSKRPDKYVSVVELELDAPAQAVTIPVQQPDSVLSLPAHLADLKPAGASSFGLGQGGVIENWTNKRNRAAWRFKITMPGDFSVRAVLGTSRGTRHLVGGHVVTARIGKQKLQGTLGAGNLVDDARTRYFKEAWTDLGTVSFDQPGDYTLELAAESINREASGGLVLAGMELLPMR